MKILADENIDRPIVERLRQEGHTVAWVAEMAPGLPDAEVLTQARQSEALLLTADKDFGELVYRQGMMPQGVILLRLAGVAAGRKAELVSAVLSARADELVHGFTVITPQTVRVRHGLR